MGIKSHFKKLFVVAATGALAFSFAPVSAQAFTPGEIYDGAFAGHGKYTKELVRKHIAENQKKYGSPMFARLALAFDNEFLNKAGASGQAIVTRRCLDNAACASVRGLPMDPIKPHSVEKFHAALTEQCAKLTTKPGSGVTFKKYNFTQEGPSKFVIAKAGTIQTNATQQSVALTLKNAESYTKTNTIGWNVEASLAIKGIVTLKSGFQSSWANAVSSTAETWRTVQAKPGESYRLDKGHQETTGKVTALFDTTKQARNTGCRRLIAKDTKVTVGHSASEVVHQVNTSGMIIRDAPRVEAQRGPKPA
ncbi:hypothetical protein [Austwickia chelonae]|uniref:hypothetical protein n=1 Tax=Austwickia chelonae TaxID=100225 RepID=UPI000E274857|nr:hypothetical protein [Austwickia chelonae]